MVLGVDFDNTIVRYDDVFHRVAAERGLIQRVRKGISTTSGVTSPSPTFLFPFRFAVYVFTSDEFDLAPEKRPP